MTKKLFGLVFRHKRSPRLMSCILLMACNKLSSYDRSYGWYMPSVSNNTKGALKYEDKDITVEGKTGQIINVI